MQRTKPDVDLLLGIVNEHGVEYVVTGSAAAMLHGVVLDPGDLDITPALGYENLERLAAVLEKINARQYEDAPFGHWETNAAGEHRWVTDEPTPEKRAARASWTPDPRHPATFDHLLATLTVPRRERDADRVRRLRSIQRRNLTGEP